MTGVTVNLPLFCLLPCSVKQNFHVKSCWATFLKSSTYRSPIHSFPPPVPSDQSSSESGPLSAVESGREERRRLVFILHYNKTLARALPRPWLILPASVFKRIRSEMTFKIPSSCPAHDGPPGKVGYGTVDARQ